MEKESRIRGLEIVYEDEFIIVVNKAAGLQRVTIFSPDGAADYMRTRLNRMSDATFARFIEYQTLVSERPDLIGAGSHVVDVVRVG